MNELLLAGGSVYVSGRFETADVLIRDGKIAEIGRNLTAEKRVNAADLYVVPGFIDAHTHGAVGVDVNAAGVNGLRKMAAFFASQGTTAFQASVLTDTDEVTQQCLGDIETVMQDVGCGAQLLGAHLEGPFLAPAYKGAMPEHLLRTGDAALLRKWQTAFPGVVRYLTVSPEVAGVNNMIREVAQDVVVSIGHSGADYDTAMQAIDGGARTITHTFNAMRLFHQHEPAIMGAALESDCWCEAICDGRHLAPGTVRMLLKCKGMHRVMAVTDSIMAAGLPDGDYKLGVNEVMVVNGDAKLKDSGVRAGSTLTMIQALRNLIKFTGKTLAEVLPILTKNPADALRLAHKGCIAPGMDADIVLLSNDLSVRCTIVGGHIVYENETEE